MDPKTSVLPTIPQRPLIDWVFNDTSTQKGHLCQLQGTKTDSGG